MVLLVHVNDLLDLVFRAQVDTAAVVDVLGHGFEKTFCLGVDGQTACVLEQHGHGSTLVQDTELALGALGVGGVGKETTVEKGTVCIGDHATNVTSAVWLLALSGELEGVEVLVHPRSPVHAVTLVDRVDTLLGRHLHAGVGQDELSQRVFHSEAVDITVTHGDHQLSRCTIHGESSRDHLRSGTKDFLGGDLLVRAEDLIWQLIDTEDCANRNACVKVGRTVDRVTDNGVAGVGVFIENNLLLLLLRDEDAALAGASHCRDEDIISNHIQLLLIITGSVRGPSQSSEVDQGGTTDVVGNGLEGELKGMAEETVEGQPG